MPTLLHRSHLLLIVLLCTPLATLANPSLQRSEAKGKITAVTVYQNLARVTRQISITAQAGSQHIVLSDLPGNLSPDSIQASADQGLQIGSVSSQRVFSTALNNSHEQTLTDQIQALKDQQQAAQDRVEAARTQQAFIKSISVKPGNEDSGLGGFYASPEAWSKAWRAIGGGMQETQAVIREAQIDIRKLAAQVAQLEQELKQIRSNRRHSSSITVAADVIKPGRHTVEVSYNVPNA